MHGKGETPTLHDPGTKTKILILMSSLPKHEPSDTCLAEETAKTFVKCVENLPYPIYI